MTSIEVPYSIAAALPTLSVMDITNEISQNVARSSCRDGIAYVHATHGLSLIRVQERETGIFEDLEVLLERIVPSDSQMRERLVVALLGPRTEQVPFADGRLSIGQWQRILLFSLDSEHRHDWTLTLLGERLRRSPKIEVVLRRADGGGAAVLLRARGGGGRGTVGGADASPTAWIRPPATAASPAVASGPLRSGERALTFPLTVQHTSRVDRAKGHTRLLAGLALGLLALTAELAGRSLTHRLDVGRHVGRVSYAHTDYYPFLLAAVKVGVALMLARVAWRFARAHAAARAAHRVAVALGARPSRRTARVRIGSPHGSGSSPSSARRRSTSCRRTPSGRDAAVVALRPLAPQLGPAGLRRALGARRGALQGRRVLARRGREHRRRCRRLSPPPDGRRTAGRSPARNRGRRAAAPVRPQLRVEAASRACVAHARHFNLGRTS